MHPVLDDEPFMTQVFEFTLNDYDDDDDEAVLFSLLFHLHFAWRLPARDPALAHGVLSLHISWVSKLGFLLVLSPMFAPVSDGQCTTKSIHFSLLFDTKYMHSGCIVPSKHS
jgi:hypothetical protein